MNEPEDKKKPDQEVETDTGNGEPPREEAQDVASDTGNGEPPPN